MTFSIEHPNTIDEEELYDFFQKVGDTFVPPLRTRIDIPVVVKKIRRNATLFVYREEGKLIACNAVYVNKSPDYSYATFLAVVPEYEAMGIGARLVLKAINYCRAFGTHSYRLQIRLANSDMLNFYLRHGFVVTGESVYPNSTEKNCQLELVF